MDHDRLTLGRPWPTAPAVNLLIRSQFIRSHENGGETLPTQESLGFLQIPPTRREPHTRAGHSLTVPSTWVCIKTWGTRWNSAQIIWIGGKTCLVWVNSLKDKGVFMGWSEAYSGLAWLNKNRPISGSSPTRTVKAWYGPSLLETCYAWACPFSRLGLSMTYLSKQAKL